MTYEPTDPFELSDPLGTICLPDFDTDDEACPSCQRQIESWSLEIARFQAGLCACSGCGIMMAA